MISIMAECRRIDKSDVWRRNYLFVYGPVRADTFSVERHRSRFVDAMTRTEAARAFETRARGFECKDAVMHTIRQCANFTVSSPGSWSVHCSSTLKTACCVRSRNETLATRRVAARRPLHAHRDQRRIVADGSVHHVHNETTSQNSETGWFSEPREVNSTRVGTVRRHSCRGGSGGRRQRASPLHRTAIR